MAVSFNRYALSLPEAEKCELVSTVDESQRACTNVNYGRHHYTNNTSRQASSVTVPLCVRGEVQLRFLCPEDLEEVRALCQDWFPIGECHSDEWQYSTTRDLCDPAETRLFQCHCRCRIKSFADFGGINNFYRTTLAMFKNFCFCRT